MLFGGTTSAICQLQALSPGGRCKTFDDDADGYGRGEGVAIMVLRSFQGTSATLLIVHGSAVNQVRYTPRSCIYMWADDIYD